MIQWVVTSSILIIVVAALRLLLRGRISLRLQYALWALVLLRLLVPLSLGSSAFSIGNLTQKAAETQTAQVVSVLTQFELPRMTYGTAYAEVAKEYAEKGVDIAEMSVKEYENVDYEIRHRMKGQWSVRDILKTVWLSVAAVMALCLIISNLSFAARLRRSRRKLLVDGCALPVYVSEIIDTPCLFGLFRPCVYVTPPVAENETVLRHSVEHETTHFRHLDHIWALLRGVCLALHWYNPLVWLAAALSRRDAELACDEATIKRLGESERTEYGRTLIGLTCQKRTALLLAATTMTGSKSSIKERIMLIAKKPKMAIYTLIAVILIAAVAVGCTFTGAANDVDKPWTWMQNLSVEDIASATAWHGASSAESELSDGDVSELISILNDLEKGNFTENKQAAGVTPEYGLAFECGDASFFINQADAPSGSLEMSYGGKQWWIDSEELHSFILALAEGDEQVSPVEVESLIINVLNSDGAYAEAAEYALIESLMENPVATLEKIGGREEGVADFLCWSLAYYIRDMALDTSDALSGEGLSESGLHARDLILTYFAVDTPAPKSWRMVYLDFFDNELPELSEDRIIAVGLFDTQSDGVPELAVWYEASTDGVQYYTDGKEVYRNEGTIFEGAPPEGVLRAQDGENIKHDEMNAFLNSWRP